MTKNESRRLMTRNANQKQVCGQNKARVFFIYVADIAYRGGGDDFHCVDQSVSIHSIEGNLYGALFSARRYNKRQFTNLPL